MLKYTQISNVSFVDQPNGGRLWAHFILIDEHKDANEERPSFENTRQIRGFTNGGLSVFTYWIKPDAEVKIEDQKGGSFVMLRDNKESITIGSGIRIIVDELVLDVALKDHDQPMDIRSIEVDSCPHGAEVDEEILKYYKAPNYCVTAYVPKHEALSMSRRLSSRC